MLHIEQMITEDFSFAVQLANTMDWKMTVKDFEFMLTVEPFGCFVLYDDLEKIGLATCVGYGRIGWFGNLVVKKEFRDQGAGGFLLKKALTYLRNKGVQTIGLYSYPKLTDFYKKFEFKINDEFIIFQGKPSFCEEFQEVSKAEKKDFSKLLEFDFDCLGFDRNKTLDLIFSDKSNIVYYSAQNNLLNGYIIAKICNQQAEIGPLVVKSNSESVAVDLLSKTLISLSGFDVFISVPKRNEDFIDLLVTAGLRKDTNIVRMFLGPSINNDCSYLPESLERG
ncbi:MAG: GNAT family N-acetyltransferase [Candidatus Bathyarchaeota archaeon]|nr:GNAT family N-acetyltransferase [Candidatus Bathyarchaeota archaeon]